MNPSMRDLVINAAERYETEHNVSFADAIDAVEQKDTEELWKLYFQQMKDNGYNIISKRLVEDILVSLGTNPEPLLYDKRYQCTVNKIKSGIVIHIDPYPQEE